MSVSNIIGADALTGSNLRLRLTLTQLEGGVLNEFDVFTPLLYVFFILRMLLLLGEVKCMGVQKGI